MPDKVVDASAIAALVFAEPEQAEVLRHTEGCVLHAPTLIDYELGNVCWKKIQRSPEQKEKLLLALQLYSDLTLAKHEIDMQEVISLATRRAVTFYDAAYLWLARELGCQLVTFDQRLQAASGVVD